MKHKMYVTGIPLWSEFKRYPRVWCESCREYHVKPLLYLWSLVKWEVWFTWTNRFYYPIWANIMEKLGLYERKSNLTLPTPKGLLDYKEARKLLKK